MVWRIGIQERTSLAIVANRVTVEARPRHSADHYTRSFSLSLAYTRALHIQGGGQDRDHEDEAVGVDGVRQ